MSGIQKLRIACLCTLGSRSSDEKTYRLGWLNHWELESSGGVFWQLMLAVSWISFGAVSQNTYTCPLHIAWASPHCGTSAYLEFLQDAHGSKGKYCSENIGQKLYHLFRPSLRNHTSWLRYILLVTRVSQTCSNLQGGKIDLISLRFDGRSGKSSRENGRWGRGEQEYIHLFHRLLPKREGEKCNKM